MTCRDYCPVCNEMVGDYDVMCNNCDVSLCYDCATTYDSKSRICIINAKIQAEGKKTSITIEELNQYYLDLKTEIIDDFINTMKENDYYEMYENAINDIEEIVNYYKNNDDINQEIKGKNLNKFINCVDSIYICINDCEFIPFICLMCHKGMKVAY